MDHFLFQNILLYLNYQLSEKFRIQLENEAETN
jgi:hypothetical protein